MAYEDGEKEIDFSDWYEFFPEDEPMQSANPAENLLATEHESAKEPQASDENLASDENILPAEIDPAIVEDSSLLKKPDKIFIEKVAELMSANDSGWAMEQDTQKSVFYDIALDNSLSSSRAADISRALAKKGYIEVKRAGPQKNARVVNVRLTDRGMILFYLSIGENSEQIDAEVANAELIPETEGKLDDLTADDLNYKDLETEELYTTLVYVEHEVKVAKRFLGIDDETEGQNNSSPEVLELEDIERRKDAVREKYAPSDDGNVKEQASRKKLFDRLAELTKELYRLNKEINKLEKG